MALAQGQENHTAIIPDLRSRVYMARHPNSPKTSENRFLRPLDDQRERDWLADVGSSLFVLPLGRSLFDESGESFVCVFGLH